MYVSMYTMLIFFLSINLSRPVDLDNVSILCAILHCCILKMHLIKPEV